MRGAVGIALAAGLVAACAASAPPAGKAASLCAGAPATIADVRPVLERRCLSCHAGDGLAAEEHDFSRVDVLRAQRGRVADAVAARAMPPAGRAPLTDAEAETLARWASCGER